VQLVVTVVVGVMVRRVLVVPTRVLAAVVLNTVAAVRVAQDCLVLLFLVIQATTQLQLEQV
jgi:hypothetical protein